MFVVGFVFLIPAYQQFCEQGKDAKQQDYPSYHVALIAIRHIAEFLDVHNWLVTALFAGLVTLFTWRLWQATNEVRVSTDKLWDAGEAQRALSEQTAERQLRAYVSIVSAHVKVVAADNNRFSIKGNLQFKNSGQTPAYKFAPWAMIAVFDEGVEPTEKVAAGQDAIMGPGVTNQMDIVGAPLAEATIEAIRKGTKTVWIWGEVSYADAFGNEYIFEHRSKIGRIRPDLNGWPVVAVRTTERKTN